MIFISVIRPDSKSVPTRNRNRSSFPSRSSPKAYCNVEAPLVSSYVTFIIESLSVVSLESQRMAIINSTKVPEVQASMRVEDYFYFLPVALFALMAL